MKLIDKYLNDTAMYYLVLRGLAGLAALAIVFGLLKMLPFSGLQFFITLGLLIVTCYFGNLLLAKIFKAKANLESSLITALILFFILAPVKDLQDILVTVLAGLIAMTSKYVITIHKRHIFNPAAFAALTLAILGFGNEIWWVGSLVLAPFVLVMGLLVVRKIKRFSMVLTFLAVALVTIIVFNLKNGLTPLESLIQVFSSWPIVFFGMIMLTEPLTTPTHRKLQIIYGGLVGVLFGAQFEIGPFFSSPELALIIGNIFSYVVSPRQNFVLKLTRKTELAPGIFEFAFPWPKGLHAAPGQYLEWTLPHKNPDNRGFRRYFSVVTMMSESELKIAIRMAKEHGSSFKRALLEMKEGDEIETGYVAGDFVLPKDKTRKLVFIAGGIGITPFRAMADEKRDAVLFFAVSDEKDLVYVNDFKNFKVVPVVTSRDGFITREMLTKYAPDFKERIFYLSGPNAMVDNYKKMIKEAGVASKNIITDYFPGY